LAVEDIAAVILAAVAEAELPSRLTDRAICDECRTTATATTSGELETCCT